MPDFAIMAISLNGLLPVCCASSPEVPTYRRSAMQHTEFSREFNLAAARKQLELMVAAPLIADFLARHQ